MKENLGDLMIDLETLGSSSNSVIVSIGAVEFDLKTGQTGKEFYQKIDIQSAIDAGLKIEGDTLKWWFLQSPDSHKELFSNTQHLNKVLLDFYDFIKSFHGINVWGNSNRFDLGLLENAYHKIFLTIPWEFRNERDVRTLTSLKPELKKQTEFIGTQHNPIDDCKYQISYCTKTYNSLNLS